MSHEEHHIRSGSSITQTRCPGCSQSLRVTVELVGKRVRCKACGERFVVLSAVFDSQQPSHSSLDVIETLDGTAAKNPTVESKNSAEARADARPESLGKIGRFELKAVLGQGGFGKVYAAHDPLLDRPLALKVPRTIGPDAHEARRFHTEARAAASLKHPNIVAVYESGEADGVAYIATEFVEGKTLTSWVQKGTRDFRRAAIWVRVLAEALAYAHEEGVIHRDIKSDNILIAQNQRPMLMDFGLAKQLNQESSLTTDGSILGTPAYMSPEQARGESDRVGPQSDQYSLGAVLYELLTGQRPFSGPAHAVVAQVVNEQPVPPCAVDAEIPRDLEAICMKAMAKEPDDRYRSVVEFADDLERWLAGELTRARPAGLWERTRRWCRDNRRLTIAFSIAATSLFAVATLTTVAYYRESKLRESAVRQQEIAEDARKEEAAARVVAEAATRTAQEALAREREAQAALSQAQQQVAKATNEADRAQERERAVRSEAVERQAADRRLALTYLKRGRDTRKDGDAHQASLWLAEALRILPPGAGVDEFEVRSELEQCRLQSIPLRMVAESRGFALQPNGALALLKTSRDQQAKTAQRQLGTYGLWSLESGQFSNDIAGLDKVDMAVFGGDGKSLVTASSTFTMGTSGLDLISMTELCHWRLDRVQAAEEKVAVPGVVSQLEFSSDGKSLLAVANELRLVNRKIVQGAGSVRIYDFPSLEPVATLKHEGRVNQVVWMPSVKRVLSSQSTPNEVIAWDTDSSSVVAKPMIDAKSAPVLRADATGQYVLGLFSTYPEDAVRIWNADGQPLGKPISCSAELNRVACSVEPPLVAVIAGTDRNAVKFYELSSGAGKGTFPVAGPVKSLCFLDEGQILCIGMESKQGGGSIQRLDVQKRQLLGEAITTSYPTESIVVNAQQTMIATKGTLNASDAKKAVETIEVWDASTMKRVGAPITVSRYSGQLRFDEANRLIAGGTHTYVWSVPDQVTGSRWPLLADGRVQDFAVLNDGETIIADTLGGVCVWDRRSRHGKRLPSQIPYVRRFTVDENSNLLAVVGDEQIELWDVASNPTVVGPGIKTRHQVEDVIVSPDRSRVLVLRDSAREQRGAQLYSISDGQAVGAEVVLGKGAAGRDSASGVAFSPGGRYVASVAVDWISKAGEVVVMNAVNGQLIHRKPLAGSRRIVASVFSEDGNDLFLVWEGVDTVVEKVHLQDFQVSTVSGPFRGRVLNDPSRMGQVLMADGTESFVWDIRAGQRSGSSLVMNAASGFLSPNGKVAVLTEIIEDETADGAKKKKSFGRRTAAYNMEDGRRLAELPPELREVEFGPSDRFVVCRLSDGLRRVWDLRSGQETAHEIPADAKYRMMSKGKALISEEATISMVDLNDVADADKNGPLLGHVEAIDYRDGNVLLNQDDRLMAVDLRKSKRKSCDFDLSAFSKCWLATGGQSILITEKRPNATATVVQRWRVDEPAVEEDAMSIPGKIQQLASDSRGERLVYVSDVDGSTVSCVSFPQGTNFRSNIKYRPIVETSVSPIRKLAISPDGELLAILTYGRIDIWSLSDQQRAATRFDVVDAKSIVWVDAKRVAVMSSKSLSLLDVQTGEAAAVQVVGVDEGTLDSKAWCGVSADRETLFVVERDAIRLFQTQGLRPTGRMAFNSPGGVVAVNVDDGVTLFTQASLSRDAPIEPLQLPRAMSGGPEEIQRQVELRTASRLLNDGERQLLPAERWIELFYEQLETIESP